MRICRVNTKNKKIVVTGFAAPLKDQCYEMYKSYGHMEPEYYEDPDNEKARYDPLDVLNKSPVELWIANGNFQRTLHPNYWCDKLFSDNSHVDILFIKDVRFENEINKIVSKGGSVHKLTNKNALILDSVTDRALDGYTGWKSEFDNSGSMTELATYAHHIFDTEIKPYV